MTGYINVYRGYIDIYRILDPVAQKSVITRVALYATKNYVHEFYTLSFKYRYYRLDPGYWC